MELGTRIIGGKAPRDATVLSIAFGFQGGNALAQVLQAFHPTRQTDTGKKTDLDLGHIQPTAMFRGVMDPPADRPDQPVSGCSGRSRSCCDAPSSRHGASPWRGRRRKTGWPCPAAHTRHRRALPALVPSALGAARPPQGHQLFVKADFGVARVVLLDVSVQHILHGRDELRSYGWDAPLLVLPRLEFVFLSNWRMVSGEIDEGVAQFDRFSSQQANGPMVVASWNGTTRNGDEMGCLSTRQGEAEALLSLVVEHSLQPSFQVHLSHTDGGCPHE